MRRMNRELSFAAIWFPTLSSSHMWVLPDYVSIFTQAKFLITGKSLMDCFNSFASAIPRS